MTGETDLVAWTSELEDDARFDVLLDYACHDGSVGNRFLLEAPGATIEGTIAGTVGWDRYTTLRIGTRALRKGSGRIPFRPSGPIQGALVDLKQLTLVPAGHVSE